MASGEILRVREVSHRLLRSIARQKRMTIGDRDFYHHSLRRLVAIELKLGSFDAAYEGRWSCT